MAAIHRYAEDGDTAGLKRLLLKGIDVNQLNGCGLTPLHISVRENRYAITEMLLMAGGDVDARDRDGNPPILATSSCDVALIKLLLAYGADPNTQNNAGQTILDLAYEFNAADTVRLLRAYNAESTIKPEDYGLTDDDY